MQRFIISPLFALSRFFINIYGIFLKFFLQLNGGYWSRIGLAENITEERIKKRRDIIIGANIGKNFFTEKHKYN